MKGYTVIEVMVVLGTIAVLAAVGVLGLRGADEREQLVAAQRQLLGDLRITQNKAISGREKAGFGIKKESDSAYAIYRYRFSDLTDCSPSTASYDCPGDETSCSYCWEKVGDDISFKSSFVSFAPTTSFNIYFFRPPNTGTARLVTVPDDPLSAGLVESSVAITLTHERLPASSKRIVVEAVGDIAKVYED
jgi:Tfp pilus assembly major pilin PilA